MLFDQVPGVWDVAAQDDSAIDDSVGSDLVGVELALLTLRRQYFAGGWRRLQPAERAELQALEEGLVILRARKRQSASTR